MKKKQGGDDGWVCCLCWAPFLFIPLSEIPFWIAEHITIDWSWFDQFLVLPSLTQCYSILLGISLPIGFLILYESLKNYRLNKEHQLKMQIQFGKPEAMSKTYSASNRKRIRRKKWTHEDIIKRYPNLR